jgi:hypothetical protein
MRICLLLAVSTVLFSQETQPPPIELTDAEKHFQESMNNVKMVGHYLAGEDPTLHDDGYVIERVSKIKDDTWKIEARIQYNKKDFTVALNVPIKFAGDTPVISLTNFAVPGFGTFTARVVIYNGTYAGTWGGAGHGGTLFGKVVKNETATPQ